MQSAPEVADVNTIAEQLKIDEVQDVHHVHLSLDENIVFFEAYINLKKICR